MKTFIPRLVAFFIASLAWPTTFVVTTGSDPFANGQAFAGVLQQVSCGDTVIVQAGSFYRASNAPDAPIVVPAMACRPGQWITVRTTAIAQLPERIRVGPSDESKMAILDTPQNWPVLRFAVGATYWRFIGVILTTASTNFSAGRIGNALVEMLDTGRPDQTHHIWFDRCVFRPYEALTGALNRTVQQGIAVYGSEILVTESYFYGFGGQNNETPVGIQSATAGTSNITANGHGISGPTTINISGATGSWTRLNGASWVDRVDNNTLTWRKQIGWLTNSGTIATVRLVFKAPHNLQAGDSITLTGFVGDTDLNATFTVVTVPSPYVFTITTANVTDGDYCNDNWIQGCTFTEDSARLAVTTTGYGTFASGAEFRGRTSANTYCVYTVTGAGPLRIINNYMDCWFSSVFTGGGGGYTGNTATLTSATATGATFSGVNNLSVGDLIALQYTGSNGGSPFTSWKSVKAASIIGTAVTWTTYGNGGLPVSDSGTVNTSGSTVTWASGTHFGCQESSAGVGAGRIVRGMIVTIASTAYTISACTSSTSLSLTSSAGTQTGAAYVIATAPDSPGLARWEGTYVAKSSVVRRNTFDKPIALAFSGTCKAYHELKVMNRVLFDGNQYIGEPCIAFGHPNYNQNGNTPWNRHRDSRFTNNLILSGERFLNTSFDDPYETSPLYDHPKGSAGVVIENNLSLGHLPYWRPLAIGGMDTNSRIAHNTFGYANQANAGVPSFGLQLGCATQDWAPYTSIPLNKLSAAIRDNITGYGAYGIPIASGGSTCFDRTISTKNVLVDSASLGQSQIDTDWPGNLYAANFAAIAYTGTCDASGTNWKNCKLSGGSAYVSAATDGADPGADVEAIEDHINGWSEQAGLISYWTGEKNNAAFYAGSNLTVLQFSLYTNNPIGSAPSGTCTVELYTNKSRRAGHADTNTSQKKDCIRLGNPIDGNTISFLLGSNNALTASTTYYYKITDNTRVMVGEFLTRAAGSGTVKIGVSMRNSASLTYSPNADLSGGTTLSANYNHSIPVPTGTAMYWRVGSTGPIRVVVAP